MLERWRAWWTTRPAWVRRALWTGQAAGWAAVAVWHIVADESPLLIGLAATNGLLCVLVAAIKWDSP